MRGARAGLMISEHAFDPARAWIARVPAAIDGSAWGRWRRPGRDVQLGKMLLKGFGEDAKAAPSSQPHAAETQQRVPG